MNKRVSDILMVIVGSLLFALTINLFVIPNEFGEGGVTGITIILYYVFEWSPSVVTFVLNAILLAIGYKFLDKTTTLYTIIAIISNSVFLHFTEGWRIASNELLLNAVFGGIFAGVGIGMIFRAGGTTAGSTIIARILNKYLDWNVIYALLFLDLVVAVAAVFIIGVQSLMLTIVMLFVAAKVMDFIVDGLNPKKAVMIVSNEQNEIAEQVIHLMGRGVTVLHGHGYYTKTSQEILYVVISKQELSVLKKFVKAIDPQAFITVHDVRDVFGKGFGELRS